MQIDSHIEKLLYLHNCVVVPGFGAFLAHRTSAELNEQRNTFIPPTKKISFNSQLDKNDGLLVSHIAKEKNLGYDQLLSEVENVSDVWKKRLDAGESIELFGIGKLWLGPDQKIQFNPENRTNYLTSSFGLSAFTVAPVQREVLKEQVEELEEKIPITITPEKREEPVFRAWLKYAAVLLLATSLGLSGYKAYINFRQKQVLAHQDVQEEVAKIIQEATFFASDPLELPAIFLEVKKRKIGKHHVIAGAFRIEQNAHKMVRRLEEKGYGAMYLGVNRFGLHQVAYASFEDANEARAFLRKVQRTESKSAWLLSEK